MRRDTGYMAIASRLRAAIQRGDHPPGSLLRRHEDLAEEWGVSLETVRRAVRQLHAEGLIDATSGRGTVVRDQDGFRLPISRYMDSTPGMGPWETACAAQGVTGKTDVTEVGWFPADQIIARHLEIPVGEHVIRRRNVMRADGVPRQLQETWIPRSVAEGTPLEKPGPLPKSRENGGIYGALITAGYRPASGSDVVSARMPTPMEAELLGIPLGGGSPLLDIRCTTRDRDGLAIVHTHLAVCRHISLVYPRVL